MNQKQKKKLYEKIELLRIKYYLTGLCLPVIIQDIETGAVNLTPGKLRQYKRYLTRRFGYGVKRGILQIEIDRNFDNILQSLKADFPYFDKQQIQVFSYAAAGFPDPLAAKMVNISDGKAVWVMKNKMIETIKYKNLPRREEYLLLLGVQQLSLKTSVGGIRS